MDIQLKFTIYCYILKLTTSCLCQHVLTFYSYFELCDVCAHNQATVPEYCVDDSSSLLGWNVCSHAVAVVYVWLQMSTADQWSGTVERKHEWLTLCTAHTTSSGWVYVTRILLYMPVIDTQHYARSLVFQTALDCQYTEVGLNIRLHFMWHQAVSCCHAVAVDCVHLQMSTAGH